MLWIFSFFLLGYALLMAVRLLCDLLASRRQMKELEHKTFRQLEILEQASWQSLYSLPSSTCAESEPGLKVEDMDLRREGEIQ
jgi:hypothetical protein